MNKNRIEGVMEIAAQEEPGDGEVWIEILDCIAKEIQNSWQRRI
jgi:hypothetical protein